MDNGITAFPDYPEALTTETENGAPIGVETDDRADVVDLETGPVPDSGDDAPVSASTGMISLTLKTEIPGATVEVTILLSVSAAADETWFSYDPAGGYTKLNGVSFSGDRTLSAVYLTDGGEGDQDGSADGTIVSQIIMGTAGEVSGGDGDNEQNGSGGGSGCFIASSSESVSSGAMMITGLLLIGLALLNCRKSD